MVLLNKALLSAGFAEVVKMKSVAALLGLL
jgi:hypothetical protein